MPFLVHIYRAGIGTYLAVAFSLLSIFITLVLAGVIGITTTGKLKSNIGNCLAELARKTAHQLDRGML